MSDVLKEECGLFGIYNSSDIQASQLIYYGLLALQHRGQESAGMALVENGSEMLWYKGQGLVNEVFDKRMLAYLEGISGIGHVRYSTSGESNLENAQPLVMNYRDGKIALVHNGNLVNDSKLRDEMEKKGALFQTTSDSEVILAYIAKQSLKMDSIEAAVAETMRVVKGGYSILLLTGGKMIGFRDPNGLRPLSIGTLNGSYVFASESAAIVNVGGEYIRDVKPGEIITIDKDGMHTIQAVESEGTFCSFEYIYFSRPDTYFSGLSVYNARVEMGRQLFREHKVKADIVISVPDSGIPAAIGYAAESKIPFVQGFFRNAYVGRTFIQPSQDMREVGVNTKLSPLAENITGKRIVMVDDSLVRGTTIRRIVAALKRTGAKEVNVMVSSPPVKYSCYYGIDTPSRDKLIASKNTVEQTRQEIGAYSLNYLSEEGLKKVLKKAEIGLCTACFNGKYPVPLENGKK